jgi:hypothetical protein
MTRRIWSRARNNAERLASRDRALIVLRAAGFTAGEAADAFGLTTRYVYGVLRRLGAIRGGTIDPDSEFSAAVDAFLARTGMPKPRKESAPKPADPTRDRIEAALQDHPDASPIELATLAGTTLTAAKEAIKARRQPRSHAERARDRAARRTAIEAALRESPGESAWSIARRTGLPEAEIRAIRDLGDSDASGTISRSVSPLRFAREQEISER